MSTPDETNVWIGLDIGKTEHFADVLDAAGSPLFARAVANDEADIEALLVAIGLDLDQVIGLKPGHHQGALVSANDTR